MTSDDPERSAAAPPLLSTRAVDMLLLPTFVIAGALSALIAVAGADGSLAGRVAGLWLIWTPIGVTIATRGVRDRAVAARGNPFRRAALVLRKWFGWTGIATSAVVIVALLLTAPNEWMSRGLFISIAAGACALLLIRGPVRQVGAGILVACAAPIWPYILLVGAALIIPIIVTLLTAALSTRSERRRRVDQAERSPI
ncbi:hypothetical protein [Williamsia sp. M5A3_1d]